MMRKFFLHTIIALMITAVIALGLNVWYLYALPPDEEEKFAGISEDMLIDVVNTGTSHAKYGIHYEAIVTQQYACENFALDGQQLRYDLNILRNYADNLRPGGVVIICVSDFKLYKCDEADFKERNTRYYSFMQPRYIIEYDEGVAKANNWKAKFPLYVGDQRVVVQLRDSVFAEPPEPLIANEQDPAYLMYESYFSEVFKEFQKKNYAPDTELVGYISDMVTFCNNHNLTPILLTIPCTEAYNACYPNGLREAISITLNSIAEKYNTHYYDYSADTRFTEHDELYSDATHLNEDGGALFTQMIFREIPELKKYAAR